MKSTKHLLGAGPWAEEERDGSGLVLRHVAGMGTQQGHAVQKGPEVQGRVGAAGGGVVVAEALGRHGLSVSWLLRACSRNS